MNETKHPIENNPIFKKCSYHFDVHWHECIKCEIKEECAAVWDEYFCQRNVGVKECPDCPFYEECQSQNQQKNDLLTKLGSK